MFQSFDRPYIFIVIDAHFFAHIISEVMHWSEKRLCKWMAIYVKLYRATTEQNLWHTENPFFKFSLAFPAYATCR